MITGGFITICDDVWETDRIRCITDVWCITVACKCPLSHMATELKKKLPAKARRRKGFEISQVGANCEREYTEYDDDDENVVGGDVNLLKRGDLSDSGKLTYE